MRLSSVLGLTTKVARGLAVLGLCLAGVVCSLTALGDASCVPIPSQHPTNPEHAPVPSHSSRPARRCSTLPRRCSRRPLPPPQLVAALRGSLSEQSLRAPARGRLSPAQHSRPHKAHDRARVTAWSTSGKAVRCHHSSLRPLRPVHITASSFALPSRLFASSCLLPAASQRFPNTLSSPAENAEPVSLG